MKTRNATRASEGLPRKRPSYDLDDIRPSRPKKQVRQPPKKKFPLMKLPAEIRLKILRELLWQPEPLKIRREMRSLHLCPIPAPLLYLSYGTEPSYGDYVETTNYAFHPAILATCRKLNEEGCPVLYEENTVDVTFYCNPFDCDEYRSDWMGYAVDLASVSKPLSQRARKLRITVRIERPNSLPATIMRTYVRDLVKVLQANPQWCSLDIRLEFEERDHSEFESSDDEEDEIQLNEEILRPFDTLRRLRHVEVTGVSAPFAATLSGLMKGDSPVTDLPRMYDSLAQYTYASLSRRGANVIPHDHLHLAQQAMDAGNAADFYKHRDKVLWEVEKIARENHERIFQYDPNPVASRLSSNASVAQRERLENLAGNPP